MEHIRILVEAPTDDSVFVIDVTTTSQAIPITEDQVQWAGFLDAVKRSLPVRVQAEPVPVFWRAATASGVVSPNAVTSPTGATSNQVGGIVPPNLDPDFVQHLPPNTTHLIVVTATGSGHLRFTSGKG